MIYSQEEHKKLVVGDPRFSEIGGLPSDYHPYPNLQKKQLYIRPFTIQELKLLSKSIKTNNVKHVARAIDLCIDFDVNELTIGDFYYILMWERLNSFPKSPVTVQWKCEAEVWKLKEGTNWLDFGIVPDSSEVHLYEKDNCNTENVEALHKVNMQVYELPDEVQMPEGFDYPRVRDLENIKKSLEDPELALLTKGLQWIKGTWEEKIAALDSEEGMEIFDTGSALADTIIHGVAEHATLTCRACKRKVLYPIELNAASFFR